ncbi:hypothetical protein BGZ95_009049 [Linnemannia exigua]|uniref:Uncharacterized protein n=1 Tax=Linnemannia exigua TaxID=604196 RepID=A0AAD4DDE3_9FUNG|nr:hypothetical protein BGZ95_009049 [Linnemannia exigua]
MALYKSCQFPWIDSVVNTYAQNTSIIVSDTHLNNCCTSPGNCPNSYTGTCPYGYLDCKIGNSKYVCEFSDYSPGSTSPRCFQEGSLTVTRNKPCCPPMLKNFLMQQTCLVGAASVQDTWVCCPSGQGTCQFVMGCIGYQGFLGSLGEQYAVYTGFVSGLSSTGSSYCVEEVDFSAEKKPNCYGVTASSCNLGGGAAPPPPPAVTTTTATTASAIATSKPTSGSGTGPGIVSPTNNRSDGSRNVVKKAALLLFVPLILQLDDSNGLFLRGGIPQGVYSIDGIFETEERRVVGPRSLLTAGVSWLTVAHFVIVMVVVSKLAAEVGGLVESFEPLP